MITYHLGGSRQVSTLLMHTNKYNESELRDAVSTSTSIRQSLQKLGVIPAGGNYQTFNKKIAEYKIDTSHFSGQCWNKGKRLPKRVNTHMYLSNQIPIQSYKLKNRLFSENLLDMKCSMCNLTEWNGKTAPLELDHVDGNHLNNSIDNLRILCPNCHAQTDNYRGLNKRKT